MFVLPTRRERFVYNAEPLGRGQRFPAPREQDFPALGFKYAALERVRAQTSDYVRAVLDAVPLAHEHRYVVVDVKVSQLRAGQPPCIPGWHCDVVLDPRHPSRPEVHHLFVSGQHGLTEFVAEPVELEVGPARSPQAFLRELGEQLAGQPPALTALESCQLTRYGRWHLHRGALAAEAERRLLVRVTETDLIRPTTRRERRQETSWTIASAT